MFQSMFQIDKKHCSVMGILNPYKSLKYRLNPGIPQLDKTAYEKNPNYQFVYDKLFIAKSQGMECGTLHDLLKDPSQAKYPVFIKPRYGHLSASSKNCYKINTPGDLKAHVAKKDMMWSEFVNATEGMTDFVLVNGQICYQLTYKYSDAQNGFSDVWKYISPETKPPDEIVDWVQHNMSTYTGPFNVQYRATKIIEVGMRFARGGIYIESTDNEVLINNINDMWVSKTWNFKEPDKLAFPPFYSFKCWSPIPLIYIFPQHVIDLVMRINGSMPFYEYYFEPTGSHSLVFFQFLARDFNKSMRTKRLLEIALPFANLLLLGLLVYGISKRNTIVLVTGLSLMITTLINPFEILLKMGKNQLQFVS